MFKLRCNNCRNEMAITETVWRCNCGGMFSIEGHGQFRKHDPTDCSIIKRYRDALPLIGDLISLGENMTPLVQSGDHVFYKMDYLLPTASYKDRGSQLVISNIKAMGISGIVEDSSGNAGSSVAAYAAKAGIKLDVYVPESASKSKLNQITAYGARLVKVKGSRQDTAGRALEAARETYYASHVWNPFFIQGVKTLAYEIYEQLGNRAPEVIFLPVGNGALLLGCYLGFKDLSYWGLVDQLPKIMGVQASSCPAVYAEMHRQKFKPEKTIAEGIAVEKPARMDEIICALEATGGEVLLVSEAEIVSSLRELLKKGVYIEPTSAVSYAGMKRYLDQGKLKGPVVNIFTGHGLKAADKIFELIK